MEYENYDERQRLHGEIGVIYAFLGESVAKIGGDLAFLKVSNEIDSNNFSSDAINAYKVYGMMISEIKIYGKEVSEAINNACALVGVEFSNGMRQIMNAHALLCNGKELDSLNSSDALSICPLFEEDTLSEVVRAVSKARDYNLVKCVFGALEKYSRVVLIEGQIMS